MASSAAAAAPAKKRRRTVGPYVVEKNIGSGSFANVWRARHRETGELVAIKSINREKLNLNKKHQANLESEIRIMKRLEHPNIVRLLDVQYTERHIYLILEYCAGGDVSKFIRRHGPVSEGVGRHFMGQLARGIRFMREHNMVHRDLKPQNLLLDRDSPAAVLKIADFGFARTIQPQSLAATLCGSPLYMAPEILGYQKYDAKADLWSVGAIMYELLTGRPPYTGNNHIHLLERIKSTEVRFPPGTELSPDCRGLLLRLLRKNPVERISFGEFFAHPFLAGAGADEAGGEAGGEAAEAEAEKVEAGGEAPAERTEEKEKEVAESVATTEAAPEEAAREIPVVDETGGVAGGGSTSTLLYHTPETSRVVAAGTPPAYLDAEPAFLPPSPAPLAATLTAGAPQEREVDILPEVPAEMAAPAPSLFAQLHEAQKQRKEQQQPQQILLQGGGGGGGGGGGTPRAPRTNPFRNPLSSAGGSGAATPEAAGSGDYVFVSPGGSGVAPTPPLLAAAADAAANALPSRATAPAAWVPVPEHRFSADTAYSNDADALEAFQGAAKRARLVAQLGSSERSLGNHAAALTLYVRALGLFRGIIRRLREYTGGAGREPTQGEALAAELRRLVQFVQHYCARAELLAEEVVSRGRPAFSTVAVDGSGAESSAAVAGGVDATSATGAGVAVSVCADKMLYDSGMKRASKAAVSELMGDSKSALAGYKHAYRALEELRDEAARRRIASDVNVLQHFMDAFYGRIERLQQRQLTPDLGPL